MLNNLIIGICLLATVAYGMSQLPPNQTGTDAVDSLEVSTVIPVFKTTPINQDEDLMDGTKAFDAPLADANLVVYPNMEVLNSSLSNRQYGLAIQVYSDAYDFLSEKESGQYRDSILSVANKLLSQDDHGNLIYLLEQYTNIFFKDLDALRLLANSQHALEDYVTEIHTLFRALDEAYLYTHDEEFESKLEIAVEAPDLLFIQDKAEGAVDLYRNLVMAHPGFEPLQSSLTRALAIAHP